VSGKVGMREGREGREKRAVGLFVQGSFFPCGECLLLNHVRVVSSRDVNDICICVCAEGRGWRGPSPYERVNGLFSDWLLPCQVYAFLLLFFFMFCVCSKYIYHGGKVLFFDDISRDMHLHQQTMRREKKAQQHKNSRVKMNIRAVTTKQSGIGR